MFGDINITFDDRKSPFIDSAFAKQFRIPNSGDISNLYYPVPWRQKDHIGTDNRCFALNKENGIFLFDCGSPESQRFFDYSSYDTEIHTFIFYWKEKLGNNYITMTVRGGRGEPSGYDKYTEITDIKGIEETDENFEAVLDMISNAFTFNISCVVSYIRFLDYGIEYNCDHREYFTKRSFPRRDI
jgi:hypothetical protein